MRSFFLSSASVTSNRHLPVTFRKSVRFISVIDDTFDNDISIRPQYTLTFDCNEVAFYDLFHCVPFQLHFLFHK